MTAEQAAENIKAKIDELANKAARGRERILLAPLARAVEHIGQADVGNRRSIIPNENNAHDVTIGIHAWQHCGRPQPRPRFRNLHFMEGFA